MTFEEISLMISIMGFPYAYLSFPIGEAPNLPYIVYYYPSSNNISADDKVYKRVNALNIELYTPTKSFDAEGTVEAVLDANNVVWQKTETYIDSEHMYEVLYQTEIVING